MEASSERTNWRHAVRQWLHAAFELRAKGECAYCFEEEDDNTRRMESASESEAAHRTATKRMDSH